MVLADSLKERQCLYKDLHPRSMFPRSPAELGIQVYMVSWGGKRGSQEEGERETVQGRGCSARMGSLLESSLGLIHRELWRQNDTRVVPPLEARRPRFCTLCQSVIGWGTLPRGACNILDISRQGSSYPLRTILKRKPLTVNTNCSWGGCNDPGKGTGRSPRAATADGLHREVVHAGIEETESQMGRSVAQCKVETWALPTGRVFQQPLPNPRAEKK